MTELPTVRPERRRLRLLGLLLVALAACSHSADTENAAEADSTVAEAPTDSLHVVLTPAEEQTAGIQIAAAASPSSGTAAQGGLQVPGAVQLDSSRVAVISSRAPGRIERLSAVQGQRVRAGQTVATLSSPDYLAAQSDLAQAVRRAAVLKGTPDEQGAQALVGAARQRLLLLGASEAQVRDLLAGGEPDLLLPVPAPFSGTILETLAQTGMAVQPGEPIFRIANLSSMHVVARVPEQSLSLVQPGQLATVTVPAYHTTLPGRVARVLEELDPDTRTARVVVEVPNPEGRLKAGMFSTVQIATTAVDASSAAPAGASIPSAAVLVDGEIHYVFVRVAPHRFEKRIVQMAAPPPGAAPTDRVVITSGLRPGEPVVVQGAFTLRSELAKAGLQDTD